MKNNKKGFVLLEVIVVSSIVGLILIMMYPAFINLIDLTNTVNKYDNVEYVYRTRGYNNLVNENLSASESIKTICEGNSCTNSFYNVAAVYLVNPNKINDALNKNIYITTKRYLKHIDDNNNYTDTLLVVAYKNEDATDQNYEYASIKFKTKIERDEETNSINNLNDVSFPEMPDVDNTLIAHLYSEVNELNPGDYGHTISGKYFDNTSDRNLRFSTFNYIKFNGELWRIIGVMNNVDDGTGKKEKRVKIMRDKSIGHYSWDTSEKKYNRYEDVPGYGVNDWSQADLMNELNGDYLTKKSGTTGWYDGEDNQKTNNNYNYNIGLTTEAKSLIKKAIWNVGNVWTKSNDYDFINEYDLPYIVHFESPKEAYEHEKAKTWEGLVGLVNASDYGFSVKYSKSNDNWIDCNLGLGQVIDSYCGYPFKTSFIANDTYTKFDMYSSSGYYNYYEFMWTMNPGTIDKSVVVITDYSAAGEIACRGNNYTSNPFYGGHSIFKLQHYSYMVKPVVYLKPEVLYKGGNGTESKPYEIGLT